MKLSELRKIFPGLDPDIDITRALEIHFFDQNQEGNYRERAIDALVAHRLPVTITQNNWYNLGQRYLRFVCPACGEVLKPKTTGGASGNIACIGFACAHCGMEATLAIGMHGGLSFEFKEAQS